MASKISAGYGFSDLNVPVDGNKGECMNTCQMLASLGYECIALNYEVDLAKQIRLQPAPEISTTLDNSSGLKTPLGRPVQVLKRLTVNVSDPSLLHTLSSPMLNSYDLLAVCPDSEKTFKVACSSMDIDIISMKLDERNSFRLKPTQVGLAVERGIHFEVCYSPAVRDSSSRRNVLANAMELVEAAKGKNIIVSSRAEKAMETRAPADIVNLCQLFGINSGKCKSTITANCRAVRLHAAMRRKTVKGVVSCELIKDVPVAGEGIASGVMAGTAPCSGVEKDGHHQVISSCDTPELPSKRTGKKRRRQSKGEVEEKRTKLL